VNFSTSTHNVELAKAPLLTPTLMRAGIQDRRALHDIVPYGPVLWPKATLVAAGAFERFENSRDLELETLSQACSPRSWPSTPRASI
jgi:hypothetical protein